MRSLVAFVQRTARAVRIVVAHGDIPRPIRWLAAVGLLPLPGPFDEAVLLLVALILFVFYRQELRQAWKDAERADPERL
ncbi:MAG TPA: hypothetical protein VJ814_07810 [Gaiellaceae bacterium]|nr:hypothetical protein [Gaiellaceae bacterium]